MWNDVVGPMNEVEMCHKLSNWALKRSLEGHLLLRENAIHLHGGAGDGIIGHNG